MAKVIILNGPPGVGKDTIAAALLEMNMVDFSMSFKEPMFEIAKAALGERFKDFMDCYNDRAKKEAPQAFLGGSSPRDFMIYISESFIKPAFGNQHFGDLVAEKLNKCSAETVVMSDGGFPDEVEAIANAGHSVHIVRLHRTGCSFKGDSRNYISLEEDYDNVFECDIALLDGDVKQACDDVISLCWLEKSTAL